MHEFFSYFQPLFTCSVFYLLPAAVAVRVSPYLLSGWPPFVLGIFLFWICLQEMYQLRSGWMNFASPKTLPVAWSSF
ncbi:hypothetical protein BDP27DRAFT_1320155 [Rhodocollybia butyracea]|uniref:Uncharacterized protein n=1 Tax=Rhodocollybia butyracea TaxID=206335 RepID=A0A9P5UAZ4_9AGAR|nr:hypothetical protein BDP27DRAFT_1320155 [Rhodocollybia butyracea]